MCKRCVKLRHEGVPEDQLPKHLSPQESLEKRRQAMLGKPGRRRYLTQEEKMERVNAYFKHKREKMISVPQKWADPAIRRGRLKQIRHLMGLTCAEHAALMGITIESYECVVVKWVHLRLAESLLREHRQRISQRNRFRRWKLKKRMREAGVAMPENIVLPVPKDSQLRARAVSMHLGGASESEIAEKLALRPEVVKYWLASIS